MGNTTVVEAKKKEVAEIEQQMQAAQHKHELEIAKEKYKRAELKLKETLAKETSTIIQKQLELCLELVRLESNRAQLKIAQLTAGE